jgi:hypothetical protein
MKSATRSACTLCGTSLVPPTRPCERLFSRSRGRMTPTAGVCGRPAPSIGALAVLHAPACVHNRGKLYSHAESRSHHAGRVSPLHDVQASLAVAEEACLHCRDFALLAGSAAVDMCNTSRVRARVATTSRTLGRMQMAQHNHVSSEGSFSHHHCLYALRFMQLLWMWLHRAGARQTQALTRLEATMRHTSRTRSSGS